MSAERRIGGGAAFALALLALNAVYLTELLGMAAPFARGEPGPSFLPWLLCGFLFVAALRILRDELRAPPGEPVDAAPALRRIDVLGPLSVGALTAGFIAAFPYVGYAVATAVYVFAIALMFNFEQTRSWGASLLWSAATAAGVTCFGWLFFVRLFDLFLPGWSL